MKKILWLVVMLVVSSFGLVQPAAAARDFSDADVRGSYGTALDGFVATAGGSAPAAAVGRFVADGAGTIYNGVRTLVVGGTVTHQTFTCTYSVAPNGTGTATCKVMTGGVLTGTEHYDFVIVDNAEEALFTETDPGVTIHGTAQRQRTLRTHEN